MEKRIARLEKVLKDIKEHKRMGGGFEELYNLIKKEYQLEGGDSVDRKSHTYIDDLWITLENEVDEYKLEKKRGLKRGAPNQLRYFVISFEKDVENELDRCKG